jgi:hypothetical protein
VSGSSISQSGRYLKFEKSWVSEQTRLKMPVTLQTRRAGIVSYCGPLIPHNRSLRGFSVGSLDELFQGPGRLRNATNAHHQRLTKKRRPVISSVFLYIDKCLYHEILQVRIVCNEGRVRLGHSYNYTID